MRGNWNNITLIGMPASGKSTVGVLLAKRLGYRFIDSDLLIQEQEGCLLKDIIAARGLDGFLEVENRVNRNIEGGRAVIAPGGSVVYCREAMEHLSSIGTIVYLKLSYEELAAELFRFVLDVASGKKVKAEEAGFHDMAIFKQGVTL